MSRLLAWVVASCLGLPGHLAVFAAEAPHAVFPSVRHEFGTVRQGATVVHEFELRNEGSAPLTIRGVGLSMPAMTARFQRDIPPGEEGVILLEWDTGGVEGVIDAEAAVQLNDPAQPRVTLQLEGNVEPPIAILPHAAVFASVFEGEAVERRVTIVNNEDRPLGIERLGLTDDRLEASLEPVHPGHEYELKVRVPPGIDPGRYREAVFLHTDHPTRRTLRILVNLFVKTDLYARPEIVDFGRVDTEALARTPELLELLTRTFFVKTREGDFEIESLGSDLPILALAHAPSGRSDVFRVDVALRADAIREGSLEGAIHIRTDVERFPELIVPVRGEVVAPRVGSSHGRDSIPEARRR